MNLKQIRHISFDKDGTLIDVHIYWAHIIEQRSNRLAEKYDLPKDAVRSLCQSMGIDLSKRRILSEGPVGYKPRPAIIEAARTALAQFNIEASSDDIAAVFVDVDRWLQDYNTYDLKLLPYVEPVLKKLKDEGYKISVFTSDRVENSRRIMRQLKLESYIDVMVGGDEVKRSKPDPEGLLIACGRVGVEVAQTIYVSDTVDDMRMSRAAGAAGEIGVTTGLDTRVQLSGHTSTIFDDLKMLPDFLKGK